MVEISANLMLLLLIALAIILFSLLGLSIAAQRIISRDVWNKR